MLLQNQIESINNPQEFTRLYNAVLKTKYGDDYLAIDDDQSDKGNDGYLKSEKRLFAGHCFKRIHKQKINEEILIKMSSDLSKAIELRDSGRWDISSWTFLCNYPISEEVGAAILKKGKDANLNVSWYSADYFADALIGYKGIREQFPNLITTKIQTTLDTILSKLEKTPEKLPPITQVPTNPSDQQRLLDEKPAYWEYLYFASVLLLGKTNLELKWNDHIMHHARPNGRTFTQEAALEHLNTILSQLAQSTSGINATFASNNQDRAFGKTMQSGDPVIIRHFSMHVVNTYEDMLDWAARLRGATFPEDFGDLVEVCAQAADKPASEIRNFIDDCAVQANKIHPHLNGPNRKEDLTLQSSLVLKADDAIMEQYINEYKKLIKRIKLG